jgi:formate dehydrogenase major subunit
MSFGRGGATTAQWDLANADVILIQGSNMAECHPVAFRFVMEARERGAKIIHVDPRYTRTSANADVYAPIRPGTDIAFLGGLINYVLQHERYFKDYVVKYTNAPFLINEDYRDAEDLEGIFSGWNAETRKYDPASWTYQQEEEPAGGTPKRAKTGEPIADRAVRSTTKPIPRDDTLQDPHCVFQILKRHFARYTPEMVERICGTPQALFLQVAETMCANSGRERTGAICYAVGWTQHTHGVQNIRAAAILQLLLGNIGRPGGGILALRGHAAIQGSTDTPTLFNLLPGYLQVPLVADQTFQDYLNSYTALTGWWSNSPKYITSLLKAWYGDHATRENDWCYQYLPKIESEDDYSYYPIMFDMQRKKVKGMFVMGENFAVGGPGALVERNGLRQLQWCVVRDPFLVETARFWEMDGVNPADVDTEVFYMPAAWAAEKDGSLTNTQRLLQWHDKAVDPPGDCRSETWFMYHLGRRLRKLYEGSTEEKDQPLLKLTWGYPTVGEIEEPKVEHVLHEMNGYDLTTGKLVSTFQELKDDGTTSCGYWIYSGVTPKEGENKARKRDQPGTFTNHATWGFAWPANRRILYNRASAAPDGTPWSERKKLIWWDARANDGKGKWTGYDVPDFEPTKAPDTDAREEGQGMEAISGTDPFIIHAEGRARLFTPAGLKDGPLPTHYEPVETPLPNLLYPSYPHNPPAMLFGDQPNNPYNRPESAEYPYVLTTYRLTEHHTSGAMSRWLTWLSELQPVFFCEISPALAHEKGIETGDWVTLTTARTSIEARALVSDRIQTLTLDGRQIHVVGLPYLWGPQGVVTGDAANDLVGIALDPNVRIHEGKALTCNLRKGRKRTPPRGALPRAETQPNASTREGGTINRTHSEGAEMLNRTPLAHKWASRRAAWPRGSSRTPPSASAAKPARWRANSGINCRQMATSSPA